MVFSGSLFPSAVPWSACEASNESKILCSPEIWEALNFILSVLINAMPQRYAVIKYFLCSRPAFLHVSAPSGKQLLKSRVFRMYWCEVKHEIYRDENSGNGNHFDLSANRDYRRDGKQSSCSTVKFVSNYLFTDENHFARKLSRSASFRFFAPSVRCHWEVLWRLQEQTFDWILQQRSRRFVICCWNNHDAAFV